MSKPANLTFGSTGKERCFIVLDKHDVIQDMREEESDRTNSPRTMMHKSHKSLLGRDANDSFFLLYLLIISFPLQE